MVKIAFYIFSDWTINPDKHQWLFVFHHEIYHQKEMSKRFKDTHKKLKKKITKFRDEGEERRGALF